jgi:integrase
LTNLDKFFAVRKVNTITTDEIRRFVKERQAANASNGTINRSLSALKRMFSLAIRGGKLQNAPHIELLKEAPPRQGFLESEDFKRLGMELPEHLRAPFTLAYFTGLRLGEIRRLRWDNVDLRASEIRLYGGETKNDEPRTVPLMDELPLMLRMLREKDPRSDYVFSDGSPLGSFRKSWRSACVRAGLGKMQKRDDGTEVYTGLLFHDLRRSGVRNLARAGVPERVAIAISGHKTRAVFERYNIVSSRDIEEAGQRLSKYFKKQAEVQLRMMKV